MCYSARSRFESRGRFRVKGMVCTRPEIRVGFGAKHKPKSHR